MQFPFKPTPESLSQISESFGPISIAASSAQGPTSNTGLPSSFSSVATSIAGNLKPSTTSLSCPVGASPLLDVNGIVRCVIVPLATGVVDDVNSILPSVIAGLVSDVTCVAGTVPKLDINGIIKCVKLQVVTGVGGDVTSIAGVIESVIGGILSGVLGAETGLPVVLPSILPSIPGVVDVAPSQLRCLSGSTPQLVDGIVRCIAIPIITDAVNEVASIIGIAPIIVSDIIGGLLPSPILGSITGAKDGGVIPTKAVVGLLPGFLESLGLREATGTQLANTALLPRETPIAGGSFFAVAPVSPTSTDTDTTRVVNDGITHVSVVVRVTDTVTVFVPTLGTMSSLTTMKTSKAISVTNQKVRRRSEEPQK
jgi:hypothetical protein